MVITFLSPRFYPENGGVEKHALEVAKILSKKHKITVITEGDKDQKEDVGRIKIIRFNFGKAGWFKKFIIWWKILKYRKIFEESDIIHCHDVFVWYLPLRILYPRKKVYVTFHGYEGVFPPKISAVFIRKLSERLSNGNIAVGKYIEKWYGTKASFITYGGRNSMKKKMKRLNKKIKILFIGRIENDNGIKIYSKALSALGSYSFEACGDGPLRSEFEKFGKVHGFVRNIERFIEKSDIIFSSSYLSIIQGLSFMKPVFSVYDNPLKKDYLRDAPFSKWIYVSNSARDLITQINIIKNNEKLRRENLNHAFFWVSKQTWQSLAVDYLKLWNL